jgi:hypothetical protein
MFSKSPNGSLAINAYTQDNSSLISFNYAANVFAKEHFITNNFQYIAPSKKLDDITDAQSIIDNLIWFSDYTNSSKDIKNYPFLCNTTHDDFKSKNSAFIPS